MFYTVLRKERSYSFACKSVTWVSIKATGIHKYKTLNSHHRHQDVIGYLLYFKIFLVLFEKMSENINIFPNIEKIVVKPVWRATCTFI